MTGDGVNDAPAAAGGRHRGGDGDHGDGRLEGSGRHDPDGRQLRLDRLGGGGGALIFANIQKFLLFLLSSNVGEVLVMFFGVMLAGVLGLRQIGEQEGLIAPLPAVQILWVNLLTDAAPALALGWSRPTLTG